MLKIYKIQRLFEAHPKSDYRSVDQKLTQLVASLPRQLRNNPIRIASSDENGAILSADDYGWSLLRLQFPHPLYLLKEIQ